MKNPEIFAVILIMFALCAPLFGSEETVPDKIEPGWVLSQSVGGSVNPLGLDIGTRLWYQVPLFPGRSGPLWDGARIEAGLSNSLTPAYDNFGVFFRIEPIAVFDLHLSAGVRGCYDLFGFGYTALGGYGAPYSPKDRSELDRENGIGFRYALTPRVKGAAGGFLFASSMSFVVYDMREAAGGDGYFYEPAADTVLKTSDFLITNDTVVLYRFGDGLLGGLSHYFLFVPGSDYVSERLALIGVLSRTFRGDLSGTLAVLGGTYLRDRHNSYRDGKVYGALQAGLTLKLK